MKIAIRKESNGSIYIDKTALCRFTVEELGLPPYNFIIKEVPFEDFKESDFDENLNFCIDKYNKRLAIEEATAKIEELKIKLNNTDYQAIKFAEGELTAEEYERTKNYRKQWRIEINNLEKILKN